MLELKNCNYIICNVIVLFIRLFNTFSLLVQNACINLLITLTLKEYLSNKDPPIDQDKLFDSSTMIHGVIKHQIRTNTSLFIWEDNLSPLLLNCTNTMLRCELSKLSCWIDAINILISYITTAYDESPSNNKSKQVTNWANGANKYYIKNSCC